MAIEDTASWAQVLVNLLQVGVHFIGIALKELSNASTEERVTAESALRFFKDPDLLALRGLHRVLGELFDLMSRQSLHQMIDNVASGMARHFVDPGLGHANSQFLIALNLLSDRFDLHGILST